MVVLQSDPAVVKDEAPRGTFIKYSHYAKNLADMPSVDEMLAKYNF